MSRPDWIEVGRVKRAHGINGEVRVLPSTDNPLRFAPGSVVHVLLRDDPERVRVEIEDVRGSWDALILALAGFDTREAAESLRGAVLQVPATDLPELEDGEFYPFDLEGLRACLASGEQIGTVGEVLATPAHEILSIRAADGREILVPFTLKAVPEVRIEQGYLVVDAGFATGLSTGSAVPEDSDQGRQPT